MDGFVESGVEREIPPAQLLIDDGPHLPGPGIRGILTPLIADFVRETEPDRPFPFRRDADARANVVADPVYAAAVLFRRENIEADLQPIPEAVGDFDRFVKLVVGGEYSVLRGFRALKREIAVQFDHGAAGFDGVVGIDLDFVVVLGARGSRKDANARESTESAQKGTEGNRRTSAIDKTA